MKDPAGHPDLFTPAEALEYMRAVTGTDRTLETLRTQHGLPVSLVGKDPVYHRVHLDALINKLCGLDGSTRQQKLKIAQG